MALPMAAITASSRTVRPSSSASSKASSDSVTWVMPSRPTMDKAPCTWCTWVRQNLSLVTSASATYWPKAASARSSARSISPLTQVRGPKSNSVAAFIVSRDRYSSIHLEAGDGTLEFGSQCGQFIDGLGGALRTGRGLFGNVQDFLHHIRHLASGIRLALRRAGN